MGKRGPKPKPKYTHSQETKDRIGASVIEANARYWYRKGHGRVHSEETKAKMREKRRAYWARKRAEREESTPTG